MTTSSKTNKIKKERSCPCSKNIKTPEKNPPPKDECECGGIHGQFMGRCVICFGQSYCHYSETK